MTLEEVKKDIEEGKCKMVYYSSKTLWWTHLDSDVEEATVKGKKRMTKIIQSQIDAEGVKDGQKKFLKSHLHSLKESVMPLDPTGAPLYQIDDPHKWVNGAEEQKESFGENGLEAFMFCHHQNLKNDFPTKWDEVNALMGQANKKSDFEKAIEESIEGKKEE